MKFFSSPQFISSYRGEADYCVGMPKASKGTPSVTCRFFLYQSELLALNYPEVFWKYLIYEIGTIRWRFNPESILNSQEFVPSKGSDMFQGYASGRFIDIYQSY